MASFQFNYAANMLNPLVVYGTVTNATSTNINIVGNTGINYWQANYYGTGFTYSGYEVTGGTLQSYTHSVNGVLSYRAFDFSVPAATAARYIQSGDAYGLEQIVLSGKDWIGGSIYSDILAGFSGNDEIIGGKGNDYIDGGSGTDTVWLSGQVSQYSFNKSLIIDSVTNRDGTDTLASVERLHFSDANVALDIGKGENAGEAYRIYKAAFDRAPDLAGLGYWIDQLDGGAPLEAAASGFIHSAEFASLYGTNPSDTVFVTKLYNNVLDRNPDQGGYDYWLGQMSNGMTRESVLINFSESNENISNVSDLIANGILYQEWLG